MTSAIAEAIPSIDRTEETKVQAKASELGGIALFSGIGLLLSLAVVILDQLIFRDLVLTILAGHEQLDLFCWRDSRSWPPFWWDVTALSTWQTSADLTHSLWFAPLGLRE